MAEVEIEKRVVDKRTQIFARLSGAGREALEGVLAGDGRAEEEPAPAEAPVPLL